MKFNTNNDHRRSSAAKSSRSIKAKAAGRRIEAFMKKSQANGTKARNAKIRAELLLKRLGL